MGDISAREILQRLRALDLKEGAQFAVSENLEYIADLNRQQLSAGTDARGEALKKYSSNSYAKKKEALGSKAPYGVADLKLTGEFHESIEAKAGSAGVTLEATSKKTPWLLARDNYALGLSEKSVETLRRDKLRDAIRRYITRALGIKQRT